MVSKVVVKNKPLYYAVAAITLDGYIARKPGQNSTQWTSKEDYSHLKKMEAHADILLLARTTFEFAKKGLSKYNCIVLTSKAKKGIEQKSDSVIYLNPSKKSLAEYIAEKGYKKICVLGGRGAYDYCLQHNTLDELYITIEPVLFGKGIGMFSREIKLKKFSLVSSKKLNKKGSLLLHYKKSD